MIAQKCNGTGWRIRKRWLGLDEDGKQLFSEPFNESCPGCEDCDCDEEVE